MIVKNEIIRTETTPRVKHLFFWTFMYVISTLYRAKHQIIFVYKPHVNSFIDDHVMLVDKLTSATVPKLW